MVEFWQDVRVQECYTVVHQENGFDHVYFWAIKQHYTIKVMILMSL